MERNRVIDRLPAQGSIAAMHRYADGIERFVKSFAFSATLFFVWGFLAAAQVRSLYRDFRWTELLWTTYNALLAILFLVRSRPSVVSLLPIHWAVALITSFAGMLFQRNAASTFVLFPIGDGLVYVGVLGSILVAVTLGRSYDFVPALRGVQTGWLYRLVRHPMYTFSITVRLGYVLRNVTVYNVLMLVVIVGLYRLRAAYEEQVMGQDPKYADYLQKVRFRFVPFVC